VLAHLPTLRRAGIIANMKASRLLKERSAVDADSFVELSVWKVPSPVRGSEHTFKYSLAFVVSGQCVLRYDNEQGKGDHRHIGELEEPYEFSSSEQLIADFWADVDQWRSS
jgi:hypothetical protein